MSELQDYVDSLLKTKISIGVTEKLFIYDKFGNPVDFSDKTEERGVNRLVSIDVVETVVEKNFNHFFNKTGDIKLRNNDRFFNVVFPPTLRTIYGTLANFAQDKFGIINVFKKSGEVFGAPKGGIIPVPPGEEDLEVMPVIFTNINTVTIEV